MAFAFADRFESWQLLNVENQNVVASLVGWSSKISKHGGVK